MDYDIDSLVEKLDFNKNQLIDCKNGLFLTNFEVEILKKYKIDYQKYHDLKQILFIIEQLLDENPSFYDLEQISLSIAERDYYLNSKK